MRIRTALISTGVLALMLTASGWATARLRKGPMVWDHFDIVKPGLLYRSGELQPGQLREAVARYRIRTVVNLQMPTEESEAERRLARELGVDFLNLPMPGDGFGREEQFRLILDALDDPERRPVLVHCARGTCRTGASVALYRFERDGWTIEDVTAEMVHQTYRDGYLPGYVFAMVRNRPWSDLYQTVAGDDRNRPSAGPGADGEAGNDPFGGVADHPSEP
ncbi:MAG: tyrosine-protein phosphatase [Isosphaeraceae bacterium]